MKNQLILIPFIVVLFLGFSCKPDPKTAQWDTDVLTPLVNTRIDVDDMILDSNLTIGSDSLLSLYIKNDLGELLPDEIISPLSREFSNTINLQSIDLGERKVVDAISLGEMAQGGSPAGQFIINNNGNRAISPAFPDVGPKSFAVDGTHIFETITLIDGLLEVTFDNRLPVDLTDIDFRLENTVSGDTIIESSIAVLPSMQSITESFSLANQTIEGELTAVLQRFSSPGSGNDTVLIDTSDQVIVTIRLSQLNPYSATAIFPDQNILSDTLENDEVQAGNSLLTGIIVEEGRVFLDATSTIEDQINLSYRIPSATENGIPLEFDILIDAAPPGGTASIYREVDISGYTLDLTGRPGDVGVYNTFYTILASRIDSSGNLVHLSLEDSVYLKTGLVDVTADRGFGYLGEDTLAASTSSKMDLFSFMQSGNFELEEVNFGINIENFIGAPLDLYLDEISSKRGNSQVALNWTGLGSKINIPAANLSNNLPQASQTDILIDKNNSNIDELVELKPDSFLTDTRVYINGSTTSPDFDQFIFADYGIRSSFFIEIPLHFSASGLVLHDTVSFDYSKYDADEQLQKAVLKLIAESNFPLDARVDILMINDDGEYQGTLTSADKISAATTDMEGRAVGITRSVAEYPLDAKKLQLLKNSSQVVFKVQIDSPQPPGKTRIYNTNYIDLTLSGDLSIRTK